MSRTYRINRRTYKKVSERNSEWKCRCSWCIHIPYKNRHGLTIKENLDLEDYQNSA